MLCVFLKFVVIRADIFEMPVLHSESVGDCSKLLKTKALVKVSRMRVAFDNGVELQNAETMQLCLLKAIFYKTLANMLAPGFRRNRVACI